MGVPAKVLSVEVVVNARAGGFSLDREMAEWLRDVRGWRIIPVEDAAEPGLLGGGKVLLWGFGAARPPVDGAAFRMHPDLVDCVRELHAKHAGERIAEPGFQEKRHVFRLEVRKVEVALDIEDYHAGRERVRLVGLAGC